MRKQGEKEFEEVVELTSLRKEKKNETYYYCQERNKEKTLGEIYYEARASLRFEPAIETYPEASIEHLREQCPGNLVDVVPFSIILNNFYRRKKGKDRQ